MKLPNKKIDFCPYKEHWFGKTVEAQLKPAGFRYKKGALIKARNKRRLYNDSYLSMISRIPSGKLIEGCWDVFSWDVLLVLGYNSEWKTRRVSCEFEPERRIVEGIKHTFSFLGENKIVDVTLFVWGDEAEKNWHNKIWHKARKPRTLPKKKSKKRGRGFSFDD